MASSEVSEVFTSFEDGLRGDNGSTVDVVSVNDHSSLAQIEIDSGGHSGSLGHRLDIMNQVENLLKSIYIYYVLEMQFQIVKVLFLTMPTVCINHYNFYYLGSCRR